jgi:hypothetical protein
VILLSLALVVVSAATLAWGVFASSDPLIWVSLATGVGAAALVAGSVVHHRRHLVPEAIPDAGPSAGSAAVGAASAGVDPAPSPTPSRPTAPPVPPAPPASPAAGPVSPPGTWPGVPPDAQAQPAPWATRPPGAPETGAQPGWTGPVPASPPPSDETSAVPPTAQSAPLPVDERVDEPVDEQAGEPAIERLDVRDALRVAQLDDEVLVLDGHPRYHLAGCPVLAGAGAIPLAVSAARRGGFTPCAVCAPDAALLTRSRERTRQKAEDRATEWLNDEGQQL